MPRVAVPTRRLLIAHLLTFVALAPKGAAAQAAAGSGGVPSACVSAIGPDISMPSRDSTSARSDSESRRESPSRDTLPIAVRLIASVTASELRFEKSPVVCVRLSGGARLDSVHVLARRNLATPVVRGTTYRDIYVAVEILGRLNADCIAARITGSPANDGTGAARCASLTAGALTRTPP